MFMGIAGPKEALLSQDPFSDSGVYSSSWLNIWLGYLIADHKKDLKFILSPFLYFGTPGRIRTCGLRIRRAQN